MKKLIVLLALCAVMLGVAGCGDSRERIYVANWGLFIYEPVLQMFEEEYGIRVVYSTYSTNDELYALITHQGAEFDVVVPSDYTVERMINEGRLAPINWDNVPNAQYIGDQFKNLAFDPTNRYSIPYKWGTFGIVYNTEKVDEPVTSWSILWDERFEGEIFMYNASRDTIGLAQRLLGFSMNSRDINELHQARDLLIQQRPLVRAFLADEIIDNMINGEGSLGTVYNGCARWIIYYNPAHNFVVPAEGSQLWFNSMVIPRTSRNEEHQANAEKFINFMARPDIALLNTLYTRYSTSNIGAFEMLPADWQNCPIYWPNDEIMRRGEVFVDLGDFRAEFHQAWTQVLVAGN
ncbi:MAG: spermidine/putrescine ABC transporter substrate-binding protein [Defluviitaleaceae bacterium]|nr:spermidine/putrescine ABC transporter substrate-binding protein [Defluviitaleaceae bacterium]